VKRTSYETPHYSSSAYHHFLPLRSKYVRDQISHHTKWIKLQFRILKDLEMRWEDKDAEHSSSIVAYVPRIYSALNCFVNAILASCFRSQILTSPHFSKYLFATN